MTTSIHRHLWRACARAGVLLSLSVATACSNSLGPAGPAGDTGGTGATTSSGGGGASGSGGAGAGGAGGTGATSGAGGAQGGTQQPGAPVIANKAAHRLSNTEYDNTVRDLLQTDSRFGDAFVAEEAEGFDNIATALSMSPRQVEDYFAAARTVSASVFADPALRARIVPCDPAADAACADTVITTFGRRAFRRPLEASESAGLAAKYQEARALGVDPMGALQHVVHVVLASPQFLYRIELDPDLADTAPHPVSGYELASRLSYALWSSTPDDALLARAESGELLQPDALAIEVDRMLDDSRSAMLVENFAAQWFGARRLSEHIASSSAFPTWNAELGASMRREMELYFSEFLYGSLSYGDFLTTDMNFVDGALAAHYGMAPPSGAGFQRVVVTTDQRQGLLGLAGFLTHTSRETRSSPIIRGKWILDAVWCQELRLPPNLVVEPLPDPVEGDPPTTVREQMAVHRADDACAGCHDSIDPIGLALENFDAIGRYRAVYENGLPIDTVGTLPEGQSVDGLASLSAALAQDPQFLACAAHKFGTYSLGLAMANENRDQIVTRWTSGTPTLRSLLKETVRHEMFRTRRAEGP